MPHSLAQIYVHIVFSTKNREPYLKDKELLCQTHAYLGSLCRRFDSPALSVGGVADHVHILCSLARTWSPADLVKELKRESSKWIKRLDPNLENFYWQGGYGAFSISPSHVPVVRRYIANQEAHHQRETFKDEYRRLLRKYEIDYTEPEIWD